MNRPSIPIPPCGGRRRVLRCAGLPLLAAAGGLAGCAGFGPRSIEVPAQRLEQWIAQRVPFTAKVLERFELSASAVRFTLLPAVNRVAVEADVIVREPLLRIGGAGTVALSTGLRFEALDNTVRLVNVQLDRALIDGLPAPLRQQIERAAAPLVNRLLSDRTVYTLSAQDVQAMRSRGLRAGELRVTATGLLIAFVPDSG